MATFERQGHETLYGGLIIVGIIVFAVCIFVLDAVVAAFRDFDEIVAVMPEAPGVTKGTAVWISGKPVGTVSRVSFLPIRSDSTAQIAVALQFPHEYHELIRDDSRVRLTSERFIGEPVIDILPGTSAALVAHGDTLFMGNIVTPEELREKAAKVKQLFDSAIVELRAVAGPARNRMAALAPVMRNMAAAQQELASLTTAVQNGPALELLSDGRLNDHIASLQKTAAELGPAFATARSRMTDAETGVAASMGRMQTGAERLSASLTRLQALMEENNGTMYRMSADSALLRTLHGVQAQLDTLMMEARKNPLRFVF